MNALPFHDSVVAELHVRREQLAKKYHGDLLAYLKTAEARCRAFGLHIADEQREVAPTDDNSTE